MLKMIRDIPLSPQSTTEMISLNGLDVTKYRRSDSQYLTDKALTDHAARIAQQRDQLPPTRKRRSVVEAGDEDAPSVSEVEELQESCREMLRLQVDSVKNF